jgi:hypothetical protein
MHSEETVGRKGQTRNKRLQFRNRLDEAHEKAQNNASKSFKSPSTSNRKGAIGPRGQDTVQYWGKEIPVQGPFASGLALATTTAMYPCSIGNIPIGRGVPGSCAAGTCGGAGGCGNGMVAMCNAGCTGVSFPSSSLGTRDGTALY